MLVGQSVDGKNHQPGWPTSPQREGWGLAVGLSSSGENDLLRLHFFVGNEGVVIFNGSGLLPHAGLSFITRSTGGSAPPWSSRKIST
jgi:hypothetical protein